MAKPVEVSEHACLRYLERFCGIDVAAVRAEIAKIVQPAVSVGATSFSKDGMTFFINDGRVATIVPADSAMQARRHAGRANGRSNLHHRPIRQRAP